MPSRPHVLRGVQVPGRAAAWRAAGFDVPGRSLVVDEVVVGFGTPGWWLDPPVDAEVDGLAPVAGPLLPDGLTAEPGTHPNGVHALDHVVVSTPDVERTTAALADLGLTPRRTIDALRGQPVRARFFLLGPAVLELIGPSVVPEGEAARQPAQLAGLAFVARDLDALVALAEVATGPPRPAVQPGRHIVTLRPDGLGVPVAVLTPRVRRAAGGPSR